MPAIDGISRLRSCWLPERIAPAPASNSSGKRKLKKAALGLRQNMRRSRRYWRQPSTSASGIGGQLQIDLLECRSADRQVAEPLAARERLGGQLVQQRRRVVGHALDQLAARVAVADSVVSAAGAQLAGRPDRERAPILDDRDAVGERLRL